jgi:hypothetical protein
MQIARLVRPSVLLAVFVCGGAVVGCGSGGGTGGDGALTKGVPPAAIRDFYKQKLSEQAAAAPKSGAMKKSNSGGKPSR